MPIRSSVCAYSPAAAASGGRKYSATGLGGGGGSSRFSTSGASSGVSSSTSPLSYGQYKPLGSASAKYTSTRFSSTPTATTTSNSTGPINHLSSTRYNSQNPSSYSPKTTGYSSASSSPSTSSTSGLYRPLSSASHRSSFNSGSSNLSSRSTNYSPSNCYSLSSLSISSTSSDYSSPASASNYKQTHGNHSSSAYSTASLSSASSSSLANYSGPLSSSIGSYTSPRSRRSFYTEDQQQHYERLPDGVPNGLVNLGNTCYMNASLQALYSIDAFRNLLIADGRLPADDSKVLTRELRNLFKEMRDSSLHRSGSYSPAISPANFKNAFSRYQTKFLGVGQQDAQEFLHYLINGIHEESNRATSKRNRKRSSTSCSNSSGPRNSQEAWSQYQSIVDDSPFVDILVGQLCSTITCSQCQNKSKCWDPFWDLSLSLTIGQHGRSRYGECNLLELINEFTAKETFDSDERPICEQCKKATRSTKQINLSRLPQVLILHLKKFTNDGYKLSNPDVKIETTLRFQDSLANYNLKACISHHGHSSNSGHYTSHCEYANKWFHFDDDRVRDASNTFKNGAKLDDAYVLFYTRQSLSSTSQQSKL